MIETNKIDHESDDEVIEELDIFLAGNQQENKNQELFIFQYPLRPHNRPYGDQGETIKIEYCHQESKQQNTLQLINKVQQKPKIQNFKIKYQIKPIQQYQQNQNQQRETSENFDFNQGSHNIQTQCIMSEKVETDESLLQYDDEFNQNDLNTTLQQGSSANYYIYSLNDIGQIVLTPIEQYHQFRPVFDYIDQDDIQRKIYASQKQRDNLKNESFQQNKQQQQRWNSINKINQLNSPYCEQLKRDLLSCISEIEDSMESQIMADASKTSTNQRNHRDYKKQFDDLQEYPIKDSTYLDKLAPYSSVAIQNDFSTCSLSKDNGKPNLSAEFLYKKCKNDWKKMVIMILQKSNVLSLNQIQRLLIQPSQLSKINLPEEQEIMDFLLNQNVSQKQKSNHQVAYLNPIRNNFILSSQYCVDDLSQLKQRPLIGHPFIEKMQRSQTDFSVDYQFITKFQQLLRDLLLQQFLQNQIDSKDDKVFISEILNEIQKLGIHSAEDYARNYLVYIFNELKEINQVNNEMFDLQQMSDSKKIKILNCQIEQLNNIVNKLEKDLCGGKMEIQKNESFENRMAVDCIQEENSGIELGEDLGREAQMIADVIFTFLNDKAPQGIKDIETLVSACSGDIYQEYVDGNLKCDYTKSLSKSKNQKQQLNSLDQVINLENIASQVSQQFLFYSLDDRIFSIELETKEKTIVREVLLTLIDKSKNSSVKESQIVEKINKMKQKKKEDDVQQVTQQDIQSVLDSMCTKKEDKETKESIYKLKKMYQ